MTEDIITRISSALAEVYTPEGCDIWIAAEQEQWGGLNVVGMIAAGRGEEVLATIARLASG